MESMSGSVQSAAERCRELRAAEYDSYYHTVLLSVGLKDAFGDDGPCIFKVSEPTMRTAGKKEVHPDAIFQCDGDARGVVCEIKSSLPRDRRLLQRDLMEQIGKYAEIESGWMTCTGKIAEHSVLLLVRKADARRARGAIYGDAGGKGVTVENICLSHWELAEAGDHHGGRGSLRIVRKEGSTGCGYIDDRLDGGIEMPLLSMTDEHGNRTFVKADPPDLYMLTMLYQKILPGLAGDDGHATVSIDGLKGQVAEYYTSWSGLPGEQSQTRPRWVRRALDTLCRIGLAKGLPDGRYRIAPPPSRKKSIRHFLLDKMCGDVE